MRVFSRPWVRTTLAATSLLWGGILPAAAAQVVVGTVVVESDDAMANQPAVVACVSTVKMLQARGWSLLPSRIRVQVNPYDATTPAADLVVGARLPAEDVVFTVAESLVRSELETLTSRTRASFLAGYVAAHLAPGASRGRQTWERQWVARLSTGDLRSTAIPELLWRRGGDAAMRQLAAVSWPEGAIALLSQWGVTDPVGAVGEVALAGLLHPDVLGFHAPSPLIWTSQLSPPSTDFTLTGPQLQVLPAATRTSAEGVLLLRGDEARAWAAVRYGVPDGFDVVALTPGEEVPVPLRGVAWAGVIAVNLNGSSHLSLAARPLEDFPVRLSRWDFTATEGNASIAWETARHEDLSAYVVEALARREDGGGWRSLKRVLIPVASESGEETLGYSFVDDDIRGVAAYRLLALTSQGFLAEVGVFPVTPRP